MAEQFMKREDILKELQISEAALDKLVEQGVLHRFMDQGAQKFKAAEVEAYKKKTEGEPTTVLDESGKEEDTSKVEPAAVAAADLAGETPSEEAKLPTDTSKVDLDEIESEGAEEESDQTSVLPSADEDEETDVGEHAEAPEFDFADEDLGLTLEEDEPSDSAVVADESDSSADILNVAEETPVREKGLPAEETPQETASLSDSDIVTDILEEASEEESNDALEGINLEELETPDATVAEAEAEGLATVAEEGEGSSAETRMLEEIGEEPETVGLDRTEVDTEDVGETLLEASEEEIESDEPALVVPQASAAVMRDFRAGVEPSLLGNALLVMAILLTAFTGFILLCDSVGVHNVVTRTISEFILKHI